jgi:hypothetical protein
MKNGWRKIRSPKLRAKRNERRRRRRTDPLLKGPRHPRGNDFSLHAAKRRLKTDTVYKAQLTEVLRTTPGRKPGDGWRALRASLRRVWELLKT